MIYSWIENKSLLLTDGKTNTKTPLKTAHIFWVFSCFLPLFLHRLKLKFFPIHEYNVLHVDCYYFHKWEPIWAYMASLGSREFSTFQWATTSKSKVEGIIQQFPLQKNVGNGEPMVFCKTTSLKIGLHVNFTLVS